MTHDFNDGTLGPFESGNLDRMTFTNGALECTWKPSDYTGSGTNSKKTEFRAQDNAYQFRQEFWTGFRIKLHDDYMRDNTNTDAGIMQIWGFDEAAGGANHYAMLKFDGRNGCGLVWYHRYGGGSAGKTTRLVYPNFPRNQFVDIIIHVKLSSNGSIVQIWADDVLRLDLSGQYMGWGEMNANGQINQSYSTPGSWGMYNYRNVGGYDQSYDSPSHFYDGYLTGETRTITFDNLSLWNGSNGYSIVDPTPNNGSCNNNIALCGSATQSSTGYGGIANRAIDGNTSGVWIGGSVTHTNNEANPWWEVTLNSTYSIDDINIFNRTDACCKARLSNYTVSVLNGNATSFSQTFANYPDPSISVNAGGAVGNKVRVQLNGTNSLSLAEVEVYGTESTSGGNYRMVKRNALGFAMDGGSGGANGQSIELYTNVSHNNLTWTEIDRGNGFYTYQKYGTNYCIDGGNGGANGQDVYLWQCSDNNQNQHWKKVDVGGGHYLLQKRNASSFAIDGGNGGAIDQNVYLWTLNTSNQNQHWRFDAVGTGSRVANVEKAELVEKTSNIQFYPNPVNDVLNINTDNHHFDRFEIYSPDGKLHIASALSNQSTEFQIDVSDLHQGIYIVVLRSAESQRTIRVIKK